MKIFRFIGSLFLHLFALFVIIWVCFPIGKWYLTHKPILGVDFYFTATIARLFQNGISLLPQKFLYFWYTGSPATDNIIFLWYEIIGWISKTMPLVSSVKNTMIISLGLQLFFVYLAAYRLSRHHMLSSIIAILVAFSTNIYGSLIWGGSLPFFANQLFFPGVLWTVTEYLETANKRWFWLTILLIGLAMLGHLLNTGAFILPGSLIILFFGQRKQPVKLIEKIKESLFMFVIPYIFAFRLATNTYTTAIQQILKSIFSKLPAVVSSKIVQSDIPSGVSQIELDIANVDKQRFFYLNSDTHQWLFILLFIGFIFAFISFLFFGQKKAKLIYIIPWIFLCLYSVLHVFLNANGIPFIMFQGWYREFWHFPFTLGLLCAALFGYINIQLKSTNKILNTFYYSLILSFSVFVLFVITNNNDIQKTISLMENRASTSSAFPEELNLLKNEAHLSQIKQKLVPKWMDPYGRNYRLFTSDAQMNVWWNALYDMPLARGYLDPVIGSGNAGNYFLLDQAISGDGLVRDYKYDAEIARQMSLYYIDWYSIKYFEGGHLSQSANKNISSYLNDLVTEHTKTQAQGAYVLIDTKKDQQQENIREVKPEIVQELNFYKFDDQLVSPMITATDTPAVLCFCDWPTYESITKILSMHNINSKKLITVFADTNIENFNKEEYKFFSAIILANYKYSNKSKAFTRIKDYLNSGGKIYIDTGGEVRDSKSTTLADIFPFKSNQRSGLGRSWEFTHDTGDVVNDIDLTKFSPPIFDDKEWSLSYPIGTIDKSSQVLLSHKSNPILIKKNIGTGLLYWSGMNLPYHVQYYNNFEESRLFINILSSLIPIEEHVYKTGTVNFIGDRMIDYSVQGSTKAILVRQAFFPSWQVKVNGKLVKAYTAGPNYPGFIYVPLQNAQKEVKAQFIFQGSARAWLVYLVSIFTLLFLLDKIILSGKIITKLDKYIFKKIHLYTKNWWNKEE